MLNSKNNDKNLSFDNVYSCPLCRHGEIAAMPLMEAFACNFCRHIFTIDLATKSLKLADSSSPISWYWSGKDWIGANRNGIQLGWGVALGAIALVLLPTSLVAFSAFLFPPTPGSRLAWLPKFWIGLTFFSHFWFVGSLVAEYYQFPIFVYLKTIQRRLLRQSN